MSEVDAMIEELAGIAEQLASLPADARTERARLRARRDELHAAARTAASEDPAGIRAEIERLEARWVGLQRERIDLIEQAGDLAAGNFGFTSDALRLNLLIDEAGGRAAIEDRLAYLRERLAELEGR